MLIFGGFTEGVRNSGNKPARVPLAYWRVSRLIQTPPSPPPPPPPPRSLLVEPSREPPSPAIHSNPYNRCSLSFIQTYVYVHNTYMSYYYYTNLALALSTFYFLLYSIPTPADQARVHYFARQKKKKKKKCR